MIRLMILSLTQHISRAYRTGPVPCWTDYLRETAPRK